MDMRGSPPLPSARRRRVRARHNFVPEIVVTEACLFCRIVEGSIPADVVLETDRVLAFRDISPQAPTHVLVIPKRCIRSVADAADEDETLLGSVLLAARDVARQEGLDDGFRVILNTGDEGGQTVFHLHAHVLGGRALGWPPG